MTLAVVAAIVGIVGSPMPPRIDAQPESTPKLDVHGDPLPPGVSLRLGTVAFRHQNWLARLAFRRDGKAVAAPDGDHINVWDLAKAKVVKAYRIDPPAKGSRWWYEHVAYSPDGSLLLASAANTATDRSPSRIFVWEAESGRFLRALNRSFVAGFCFCGDNRTIAVAEKSQVTVWDVATGQKAGPDSPVIDGRLTSVSFISDSKRIVTADKAGNLHFRTLDGLGKESTTNAVRDAEALAVSPDSKFVAIGGSSLVLWDIGAVRVAADAKDLPAKAASVAFSPDGSLLASSHTYGDVVVWEMPTLKKRHVFRGWCQPEVQFSPDGKTLAVADQGDSALRFWDPRTGRRLHETGGHDSRLVSIAFSPRGDRILTSSYDRTVRLWDASTGKEIRRHDDPVPDNSDINENFRPSIGGVAWSPDGAMYAGGARVFDSRDGKLLHKLSDRTRIDDVAFSRDGKFLVAEGADFGFAKEGRREVTQPGRIRWWDAKSGNLLGEFAPLTGGHQVAALTPDGNKLVLTGYDSKGVTVVWDLNANRRIADFPGSYTLAVSADGKFFIDAANSVRLFDMSGPTRLRTFAEGGIFIRCLALSPNGKIAAVGRVLSESPVVELWDIATARKIASFGTDHGWTDKLAFSPDGRSIATGSHSTVLLWRLRDLLAGDGETTELASSWNDLGGDDIPKAYRAIELLAARPDEAMKLFRQHVKPRTPAPAERVARLFADLEADDFGKREQATRDLAELGDVLEQVLVKLRKETSSPEVARRVGVILDRIANRKVADELVVQTLEAIASADAIRLLEELGRGAPGASLTIEAQAATERIVRRGQAVQ
jgi:WD40 repeat protein